MKLPRIITWPLAACVFLIWAVETSVIGLWQKIARELADSE